MDKDRVEQKVQSMDRLRSATHARYATEREILSAGEFTPDEAVRLAVNIEAYKAEASLHQGDINRTSTSEKSRGIRETVLAHAQRGNFQPLKELISKEAQQQWGAYKE